ncbi:MAG: outer membrane beta-barrel protein [Planctomycetaceae bacterium]|nr:outer membrane beta-barrel protein [Planctomycetaceae bacterium]
MNHTREKNKPKKMQMLAVALRACCALLFCLLSPLAAADDFGLINPAERDFNEFKSDTRSTEHSLRKTPTFNDRTLPKPTQTSTIRQVSTFDEIDNDPFASAHPPTVPVTGFSSTGFPATGFPTTGFPAMPHPAMADAFPGEQMHVMPFDMHNMAVPNMPVPNMSMPNMQMPNMQMPGMEHAYYPQFAQYQPDPFHQGLAYQGLAMNSIHPSMQPQFGQVPQFGMAPPANFQQANFQEVPMHELYQTMLFQALARQQAESQERARLDAVTAESKKEADANWTLNNLMPVRVSSPLGETLLVCAKTITPFNTPTGPDKGVGMPLVGKSWLDHPYYFGGFVGTMFGSELVSRMIKQDKGGTGGLIFGYNFNDYWGLESRLHFASIDIRDTEYARQLFETAWIQDNPGVPIPPLTSRTNELTILDISVHYYPLGNAKWRPYFKYGMGIGRQKFVNTFGYQNSSDIVTMPLGIGLRYWWNDRLAIQSAVFDNIVFGSNGTKTQHNFTLTAGLTYAFGNGRRLHPTHYWPATPSMGSRW